MLGKRIRALGLGKGRSKGRIRTQKPRQARAGGDVECIYRLILAGREGPPIRSRTRNIGVGGAFVVTDRPPPIGTQLTLALIVHDSPRRPPWTLELRGEVRWQKGESNVVGEEAGMGVVFYGLDVEQLRLLGGLCTE